MRRGFKHSVKGSPGKSWSFSVLFNFAVFVGEPLFFCRLGLTGPPSESLNGRCKIQIRQLGTWGKGIRLPLAAAGHWKSPIKILAKWSLTASTCWPLEQNEFVYPRFHANGPSHKHTNALKPLGGVRCDPFVCKASLPKGRSSVYTRILIPAE